jgi:drug/metabolite transporter (DMT)-like permease
MLTSFFVLSRIVANPLSNVFQKKLGAFADARIIIFMTHFLLTLICAPVLARLLPLSLGAIFWENMAICALLAVAGNTLIVQALKSADLSVLGPLNAYKSVVGLVLGIFLLKEYPSALGIAGVVMILGGSGFILDQPAESSDRAVMQRLTPFFSRMLIQLGNPGVRLRFAALVLSAAEAVFLKKALLVSSPGITFLFWCILGVIPAALVMSWGMQGGIGQQMRALMQDPGSCLLLAGTTGLMQFSTLYTFGVLQVGYSLALFQTSTLLSVLFGYRFFQEQHIARRLLGAAVMIAGAILIVSAGSAG